MANSQELQQQIKSLLPTNRVTVKKIMEIFSSLANPTGAENVCFLLRVGKYYRDSSMPKYAYDLILGNLIGV